MDISEGKRFYDLILAAVNSGVEVTNDPDTSSSSSTQPAKKAKTIHEVYISVRA